MNSSITTICHSGYFRQLSQGKIWDIDIAIPNIEVVNDEYKSISFISVDHDMQNLFSIYFLFQNFLSILFKIRIKSSVHGACCNINP